MHTHLDEAMRDDVMFKFKSGQRGVLVATDIVARGIDIDDIAMVINYDVPHDAEDYVHRIGRTARAARTGAAITFVSEEDIYYFQQIEKFLGKEVEKTPLPEGLGEAPEYKSAGKPKRGTSAKARRRNDRDHTAHKDKKQQNRRQRNNAEAPSRGEEATKEQRTGNRRNNNNRPRNEKRGSNRPGEKNNDPRTASPTRNKRRGNVEGNYKKRNHPQGEKRAQNRPSKPLTAQPAKQESGIKKFFKKIFRMK